MMALHTLLLEAVLVVHIPIIVPVILVVPVVLQEWADHLEKQLVLLDRLV
jgi:hypothetical protein